MSDDLDLDDILDSALEDFEEEEKEKQSSAPTNPAPAAPDPLASFPDFTPPGEDEGLSQEFMEGMTKLLEELAKGKENESSTDFSQVVEDLEKNLEQSPEFSGVMETLVDHLISKEVLYEPMVEMKSKYPTYLEENKGKIPEEEYIRFSKQYEFIKQICHIYETQPKNTAEIMVVMQEMQAQGQPPPEIVKALAPDMEFSPDGMPQMPDLDKMADKCSLM